MRAKPGKEYKCTGCPNEFIHCTWCSNEFIHCTWCPNEFIHYTGCSNEFIHCTGFPNEFIQSVLMNLYRVSTWIYAGCPNKYIWRWDNQPTQFQTIIKAFFDKNSLYFWLHNSFCVSIMLNKWLMNDLINAL